MRGSGGHEGDEGFAKEVAECAGYTLAGMTALADIQNTDIAVAIDVVALFSSERSGSSGLRSIGCFAHQHQRGRLSRRRWNVSRTHLRMACSHVDALRELGRDRTRALLEG
eukprot:962283-Prorocentrum_minimum.AAC.1